LIRRLTAFFVKKVNTWIKSSSPCTMTPEESRSPGTSEGKRKRVSCKCKHDLFVTHGVAKPVHGMSTCSFFSRLGESSGRLPPPRKMVMIGSVGASRALIHGAVRIFPVPVLRSTISTHIQKCGGKFKERVASADVMSTAAFQQFLNMNKLEAHFRRITAGSFKITISSAVGKLISFLYEKNNDSELATDNEVTLTPVLRPTLPPDGNDSDSSDSVHDPRAAAGFTAELHCWRTFLYWVSLIRFGLSYRQISLVMQTMRSTIPGASSEFKPVTPNCKNLL
jgi:hypothetical protein